jgi:uncharacterized membrane protein
MTMTPAAIRRREESVGRARDDRVNVGATERLISGLGGGVFLARGLSRGGLGGAAMAVLGGALLYRGVTGYCGSYDLLGINTADSKDWLAAGSDVHRGVKVRRSFTINRTPEECYRTWRALENLPRFMSHLISVEAVDERRSHWVAKAPAPWGQVEWDAEIIQDTPGELISWRSLKDAGIDNAGSVRFRPAAGGRGTEMTVELNYEPPAGRLGITLARLLGEEPGQQVESDLRKFKQLMEAGEIATVEGQTSGRSMS